MRENVAKIGLTKIRLQWVPPEFWLSIKLSGSYERPTRFIHFVACSASLRWPCDECAGSDTWAEIGLEALL